MFASRVYEKARKPLELMRRIDSSAWCDELQRFYEQIKLDTNGLSGKNFFIITRRLLFSMAAALITYELVLIQFDSDEVTVEDLMHCHFS
jgi:gustatory receptor